MGKIIKRILLCYNMGSNLRCRNHYNCVWFIARNLSSNGLKIIQPNQFILKYSTSKSFQHSLYSLSIIEGLHKLLAIHTLTWGMLFVVDSGSLMWIPCACPDVVFVWDYCVQDVGATVKQAPPFLIWNFKIYIL